MQEPTKSKKLGSEDVKALLPFFETPEVDYPALRALIAERFADNRILSRICGSLVDNVESIEAGNGPLIEIQGMVAKSVVNMLIRFGRIRTAKTFMQSAVEKWDLARFSETDTMLTMSGDESDRLDVLDRPWLDYQVYDRGHKTTMLLFCGLANRFGVEINSVALWLRSLPVNLVYIRDFNNLLYLGGLKSLGNLEATIGTMKKDLAAIGTERLISMGNSGGVYGALHYAHLLDAAGVLCFAGPTSLQAGIQEASERPVYERVQALIASGELSEPDLRQCFQANEIPVRYFFGRDYEFDSLQIKTLEDIPTVSIEGLEDWHRHIVIGEMARRGYLRSVFADAADLSLDGLNREGTLVR